jgi:ACS family tartrate transporter-like MFS transporter
MRRRRCSRISAATAFITGVNSYYLARFLLGVAEAGFFPGVAFMVPNRIPTEGAGRPAW